MKKRFLPIFSWDLPYLPAAALSPGYHHLVFQNFEVDAPKENIIDRLLKEAKNAEPQMKESRENMLRWSIADLWEQMDTNYPLGSTPCDDILQWWRNAQSYAVLFPLVKMLLAIPVASADPERSFSSSGFIQKGRSEMSVAHFRKEFRLRQLINQDSDDPDAEMRAMECLLQQYSEIVKKVSVIS